jgi:hypothetical protein
MKRLGAILILTALVGLHQDFWWWRQARPLVFGILPIGLFYHAAFTIATSFAFLVLVRLVWPEHLDDEPTPAE